MKKLNDTSADSLGGKSENLSRAEVAALRPELKRRVQIYRETQNGWKAAPVALMEIRDQRLYRADGFSDFGRFCKEELKIGKSTINRHIAIGEVYTSLASTGAKVLPNSERQMRPLLALRKMDVSPAVWQPKVVQVWEKAVNDAEVMKKRLTEKTVIHVLQKLGFDPGPKESTFDAEKAWARFENLLWHEREFWPKEHWPELELRMAGLLSGWEGHANRLDHGNETPMENSNFVVEPEPPASNPPLPTSVPTEEGSSKRFLWPNVNWDIGNSDLAAIWHLNANTVKQIRYRKKIGPRRKCEAGDYAKLLEAEKEKAKNVKQSLEG
jgi:hypothetical protein